jgi:hypothetical protein
VIGASTNLPLPTYAQTPNCSKAYAYNLMQTVGVVDLAAPSWMAIAGSNITINTGANTNAGTYNMVLTASIAGVSATNKNTFVITAKCTTTSVTMANNVFVVNTTYIVNPTTPTTVNLMLPTYSMLPADCIGNSLTYSLVNTVNAADLAYESIVTIDVPGS